MTSGLVKSVAEEGALKVEVKSRMITVRAMENDPKSGASLYCASSRELFQGFFKVISYFLLAIYLCCPSTTCCLAFLCKPKSKFRFADRNVPHSYQTGLFPFFLTLRCFFSWLPKLFSLSLLSNLNSIWNATEIVWIRIRSRKMRKFAHERKCIDAIFYLSCAVIHSPTLSTTAKIACNEEKSGVAQFSNHKSCIFRAIKTFSFDSKSFLFFSANWVGRKTQISGSNLDWAWGRDFAAEGCMNSK